MKKIVIMPGGFHPFHAGHLALYKSAVKAFPDADVYVAASDSQKERPFPFKVKEKLAPIVNSTLPRLGNDLRKTGAPWVEGQGLINN